MEDVLDLYTEKADAKHPVVSFDESPTQLIGEVRAPQAPLLGRRGAMTASIAATARRIYLSWLTCINLGGM
jgi:hypothetical protein